MFKTENYHVRPKEIDFAETIEAVHEWLCEEFRLAQASSRGRQWDLSYGVVISPTERFVCDSHKELIAVLSAKRTWEAFHWHNTYRPRGWFKALKQQRRGVGIDVSARAVEVAVHADDDLGFIERVHGHMRDAFGLIRIERTDADPYRRKMVDPSVFVARHFDLSGERQYLQLYNFLSLLGFQVMQGEEYASTDIPEKVKHRIDQQDVVVVLVTGDREHSWLVSEAGYALGKGKHIVVLVESCTSFDAAILGSDLERIGFDESRVEQVFVPLLREFRSIGVKGLFY